ncbi:hypothetical protein GWK48_01475 [Metallosphaera tengchongensis]|uniref:Uncharacterized protein n=1 Tax=Metallosphaera tengchongensis TaxID=1532350 RepID=A0A6N0NRB1_9CREN|nr:hypothetical protein [Metallosphaera tengchongensis]QKQ99241.1 hypothetical protein GWK48_01475 [Metallosphaera tengchongensis]
MEFLSKKQRTVLLTIAKEGYAGITADQLLANLSSFMSRDTIVKTLEELYFSQYIITVRDSNEVRYIANKNIRNAMISLELQKFRISKFLESLKNFNLNQQSSENMQKLDELRKLIDNGLKSISLGYIQLLDQSPEFTIPEFSEIIEVLSREVLGKLVTLVDRESSNEEIQKVIELIGKYRGEKEAETLASLITRGVQKSSDKST